MEICKTIIISYWCYEPWPFIRVKNPFLIPKKARNIIDIDNFQKWWAHCSQEWGNKDLQNHHGIKWVEVHPAKCTENMYFKWKRNTSSLIAIEVLPWLFSGNEAVVTSYSCTRLPFLKKIVFRFSLFIWCHRLLEYILISSRT